MECQNRSDKYIWSPHDAYFYKGLSELIVDIDRGNDSNLLIVFYVQIMPDDFVMQLHRF
ncbi:NAD-dependent epimerase/dehydratase family protein [Escherichia coli]